MTSSAPFWAQRQTTPYECMSCRGTFIGQHICPMLQPLTAIQLQGWRCPVCGTGIAPWISTHCNNAGTQESNESPVAASRVYGAFVDPLRQPSNGDTKQDLFQREDAAEASLQGEGT